MKYVLILVLLSCINAGAQRINISERVPELELKGMLNYPEHSEKLGTILKKPTILVFWWSGCGTCMGVIPKLDTLYQVFSKDVNLVIVAEGDGYDKVKQMLKENKRVSRLKMPVVAGDTMLRKMFPHLGVPHVVWIDAKKQVKAITGHKEMNAANIRLFAAGEEVKMKTKEEAADPRVFFVMDPMILNDYERNKHLLRNYSFISGAREGISKGSRIAFEDGIARIVFVNTSVKTLYKAAFGNQMMHDSLVDFKRDSHFIPNKETSEHVYCFDLMMKAESRERARLTMQRTLDDAFGLNSRQVTRTVNCLVLRRISGEDRLTSKATRSTTEKGDSSIFYGFTSMRFITQNILHRLPLPVVDETGYWKNVDILLPDDVKDLQLLRRYLKEQDLELVTEPRPMPVVVIE